MVGLRQGILGLQWLSKIHVCLIINIVGHLPGFVKYLAAFFKDDGYRDVRNGQQIVYNLHRSVTFLAKLSSLNRSCYRISSVAIDSDTGGLIRTYDPIFSPLVCRAPMPTSEGPPVQSKMEKRYRSLEHITTAMRSYASRNPGRFGTPGRNPIDAELVGKGSNLYICSTLHLEGGWRHHDKW